ncbi:MAG: hypothetical protein ACLRSG_07165 [Christensenellales bacterium]
MKTLESLFRRFGSPAEEMNESIYIHGTRADCIKDMKHIQSEDERARRTISEMLEYIETLKSTENAFRPCSGDLRRFLPSANQNQTEYRQLEKQKILYRYTVEDIRRSRAHDPR